MQMNNKKEHGSVIVEATIVLPVFFVAVLLIINLINIFSLHNRIQFAINSAAHELSSYSYILAKTGLLDAERTFEADGETYTSAIDETSDAIVTCLNSIQTLKGDVDTLKDQVQKVEVSQQYADDLKNNLNQTNEDAKQTVEDGKDATEKVKERFEDPKGTVVGIGFIGVEALEYMAHKQLGAEAARIFTKKYLDMGEMSADQYLRAYGVKDGYQGLSFSGSSVMADEKKQMIDIIVKYDVSLSTFWMMFYDSEHEPKLKIAQRVTVPAWSEGDGQPVKIDKVFTANKKSQSGSTESGKEEVKLEN